jgi:hypothetical protein
MSLTTILRDVCYPLAGFGHPELDWSGRLVLSYRCTASVIPKPNQV